MTAIILAIALSGNDIVSGGVGIIYSRHSEAWRVIKKNPDSYFNYATPIFLT